MKYIIIALITILLCGCQNIDNHQDTKSHAPIVIDEETFIQKYMDVYLNKKDYIGVPITLEGQLMISVIDGKIYNSVVRYGVGVCSEHEYEVLGFEIDSSEIPFDNNTWIQVSGELDIYTEDNVEFIIIRNPIINQVEEGNVYVY